MQDIFELTISAHVLTVQEDEERNPSNFSNIADQYLIPQSKTNTHWTLVIIYTLFVLLGQSSATLLGRLYYSKGGNCILLESLQETIGFPILIPFALYFSPKYDLSNNRNLSNQPSALRLVTIYISLGLIQSAASVLYAVGLLNLPVSTFSLISTTQLAFNALFSFFLNAQKLTPLILNSLVLLTMSAALLVLSSDSTNPEKGSKRNQLIGFSCTLIASALYSLMLSITQLSFQKILKRENFNVVLNMIIYQSLVATFVLLLSLFVRGEWNNLRTEMENFEMGNESYVIVLVLTTLAWQVCSIGAVGLIFEVSSLFANVIGTVSLPVVPILAAIFFDEKMDGPKVISIFLAAWGFASYIYQQYLDNYKTRKASELVNEVAEASLVENFSNEKIIL